MWFLPRKDEKNDCAKRFGFAEFTLTTFQNLTNKNEKKVSIKLNYFQLPALARYPKGCF
jgi:hypothetical protein